MNRVQRISLFNFLFVPLLLLMGWGMMMFVETLPTGHTTDRMFDDRFGYGLIVLFIGVIIFLVWAGYAIFFVVILKGSIGLKLLNLASILWLPLLIAIGPSAKKWLVKKEGIEFKERVEGYASVVEPIFTPIPSGHEVIGSYALDGQFYVLTGTKYDYRHLKTEGYYQAPRLCGETLEGVCVSVNNLEIYQLIGGVLLKQDLKDHPIVDSVYQKAVVDRRCLQEFVAPDSVVADFIQLKPYQAKRFLPVNVDQQTHLVEIERTGEIPELEGDIPFGTNFRMQHAWTFNEAGFAQFLRYEYLESYLNSQALMHSNFNYENPRGQFLCLVQPKTKTRGENQALNSIVKGETDYYLLLGYKNEQLETYYKVGPWQEYIHVKGVFFEDQTAYIVANGYLVEFEL